jgi:predicted dehydrogenase
MIAHNMRFNTVVQTIKAHLPQLGHLQSIYLSHRYEASLVEWLDCRELSGGGVVLHLGVHSFDLVRYLCETEVSTVRCDLRRILTKETEDDFTMAFQTGLSGLTGVVTGSRSTQGRTGLIEVVGERGQIVGDHVHGVAYLAEGLRRTDLPVGPLRPTVLETLKAFTTALRSGAPFPVTPQDGLRAVAIAEACYRSAATGATVELGSVAFE